MNKALDLIEEVTEMDEEPFLLCDGFEDALMGICYRFGGLRVAAYDRNKCIQILMNRDGMSYEEAEEYFSFNVEGAWVGDQTPVFIVLP